MIKDKKVIGIITARGGSKRLPKKNIMPLLNKPLIAWTIEQAKQSVYIDRLIVSTEDKDIIETCRLYNCEVPFIRPAHLSSDSATSLDVILHAIEQIPNYDLVVLLQPTSPLRLTKDIDDCIEICSGNELNSCVSVTELEKSIKWMYYLAENNFMLPITGNFGISPEKIDSQTTYVINGAVYAFGSDWIKKNTTFISETTKGLIMPRERSIDIDSKIDFLFAEKLMELGGRLCP